MYAAPAEATSQLEAAKPIVQTRAANMVFVCVGDRPTSSNSALLAVCRRRPSFTSAPRATRACSVSSDAKRAASLRDGSDPEDRARIATRSSRSVNCSLSFAPLRLPQGGDHPNQNHHRQRHSFTRHRGRQLPVRPHRNQRTIRAELTVRFPPFHLYEFPVIRTSNLAAISSRALAPHQLA